MVDLNPTVSNHFRVSHEGKVTIKRRSKLAWRFLLVALGLNILHFAYSQLDLSGKSSMSASHLSTQQKVAILDKCQYIRTPAGPPPGFGARNQSDRFVTGTKPVLLKNAKVWTGARNGSEIIFGELLLDGGIVQALGYIPPSLLARDDLAVQDVHGAWVTPGLVDLHSHLGVGSAPSMRGNSGLSGLTAPILPWLRSIDGLNTHDDGYMLAISGGVTTAQILPGSANNIGGQAFVIKLRPTAERTPTSMVVEPPYSLNGTHLDHTLTPRWRHMKHACGENPSRTYSQTRMDSGWNFRNAYNQANELKKRQDSYCQKAEAGLWEELESADVPEDLQWEALTDVLRGKVKLAVHCYEAVDLDSIVRLTHEFHFPVASFHHAGETYLVPDLLKQTWGGAPSIALFASNFRKKREAYRGSEFAPRVLAEHGVPVVMKSDHPVVNSRYLLNEASTAHYYGLNTALALASVTSTPAAAAGLGHRLGMIKEGYDADVVIWDSHPLSLGATPSQVYIDGIPQLQDPVVSHKPRSLQHVPRPPNFDQEAAETVQHEGLPPLEPSLRLKTLALTNVSSIYVKAEAESGDVVIAKQFGGDADDSDFQDFTRPVANVLVRNGVLECISEDTSCISADAASTDDVHTINLRGGGIAPALTAYGGSLGLVEIRLEQSTNDGSVPDGLEADPPKLLGGEQTLVRAVDGLQFAGRNTLLAYRAGVSTAVAAPGGSGFVSGISTAFATGALNVLEHNALVEEEAALHVQIGHYGSNSVSAQIAALRKVLHSKEGAGALSDAFAAVRSGELPLVIGTESLDIIATLLKLKKETEDITDQTMQWTFAGAAEAHLLAKEIAEAGASVILTPSRPFPHTWDQRRILPGPPLSYETSITTLLSHGVNAAIGIVDEYAARNTRFDLIWAALESSGRVNASQAIALASTNLEKALGIRSSSLDDLVFYSGGDILNPTSKAEGVLSPRRGIADIF